MLYRLPRDALAVITAFLDFMAVGRLALTCEPMKRLITSSGVVVHTSASFEEGVDWIPRLLYELPSLSTISVNTSRYGCRPPLFPGIEHPCQFGKGLKSLTLSGSGTLELTHSLTPIQATTPVSKPVLSRDTFNTFDLGKVLPQLEILTIKSYSHQKPLLTIIPTLPPSLTSLTLDFSPESCPSLSHLPNLTHLMLSDAEGFSDPTFSLSQLPHLTKLVARNLKSDCGLPDHLEDVVMSETWFKEDWALKLSKVRSLHLRSPLAHPAGLLSLHHCVSLHLGRVTNMEEVIACLPPAVTRLEVTALVTPEYPTDFSVFCLLPSRIEHLKVCNLTFPSAARFMSDWQRRRERSEQPLERWLPPNLKTWHFAPFDHRSKIEREWWTLLPASVTAIDPYVDLSIQPLTGEDMMGTMDITAHLPNITSLRIGVNKYVTWERPVFDIILPPRLTSLTIGKVGSPTWFSDHRGDLPQTLTDLSVECETMPTQLTPLPPNLTRLHFKAAGPSTGTLLGRIVKGVSPVYLVTDEFAESVHHLPSKLQHLLLRLPLFLPCTTELIKSLPRTLFSLEAKRLYKLRDEQIPHLPRLLYTLIVDHSEFSDAAVPFLPPRLLHIYLAYDRTLTHACVPFLPRTLSYLHIPKNKNFPRALRSQLKGKHRSLTNIQTRKLVF